MPKKFNVGPQNNSADRKHWINLCKHLVAEFNFWQEMTAKLGKCFILSTGIETHLIPGIVWLIVASHFRSTRASFCMKL